MRKYDAPEIEIREYRLAATKIFTDSDPSGSNDNDLNDDDDYNYFGNN
ncbi:MAG: hypothetical protein IKF64_06150 [Eubacterium sp.]|nr:hypothetical protein [Eubacterium sp.]